MNHGRANLENAKVAHPVYYLPMIIISISHPRTISQVLTFDFLWFVLADLLFIDNERRIHEERKLQTSD